MEQYTVNEVAGKKIVILIQIAIKPGDVAGHKLETLDRAAQAGGAAP